MEEIVGLANTPQTAFSELNEKHNILYKRLRESAKQRFIQKPSFALDPSHDRDIKRLERYKHARYTPPEFAILVPLTSLVVVEDFSHDKELCTKTLKTNDFWDFLFSKNWEEGCTVRVLEGQLHQLLVANLLTLAQAGTVVQHSTLAYARNVRKTQTILNSSSKEQEIQTFKETLLLEFIYYGHSVKPALFDQVSSVGYPDASTTHSSSLTRLSTDIESSENGFFREMKPVKYISKQPLPPPEPSDNRQRLRHRRIRARLQQKSFEKVQSSFSEQLPPSETPLSEELPPSEPPLSEELLPSEPQITSNYTDILRGRSNSLIVHNEERLPTTMNMLSLSCDSNISQEGPCRITLEEPQIIPRGPNYRQSCSNFSNASDEYRYLPSVVNLDKFACTERVRYLGEFDLPDEDESDKSSSEEENEDDSGPGECDSGPEECDLGPEEYVLGPHEADFGPNDDDLGPKEYDLGPEDDFGQSFYLGDIGGHEKTDVKTWQIRKEHLLKRREMKMMEMQAKPERISFMPEFSQLEIKKYLPDRERIPRHMLAPCTDKVPELKEYAAMLKKDRKRRPKDVLKKKLLLMKGIVLGKKKYKFRDFNRKIICTETKLSPRKKGNKKQLEVPLVYVTAAADKTYLHPSSRLILQKSKMQQEKERQKHIAQVPERMSLLSKPPTLTASEKFRRRKFLQAIATLQGYHSSETESPYDSSDAGSDNSRTNSFDVTRLNVKFSKSRYRADKKKRAEEDNKPQEVPKRKMQPHLFKILRKYYRMQKVFKALAAPQPKSQPAEITDFKETETDAKDLSKFRKLKHFSFLEAKKTSASPTYQHGVFFENFPAELFRENLERALKEFVVRREIVISDSSGKIGAFVTFTKKTVFSKSRYFY